MKFSRGTYLWEYLAEKIQSFETGDGDGHGARIRNDLPEGKKLICYNQQAKPQCNAKLAKKPLRGPVIPQGTPRRSHTGVGEDCLSTRLSLTLPKWHLATWQKVQIGKFKLVLLLLSWIQLLISSILYLIVKDPHIASHFHKTDKVKVST